MIEKLPEVITIPATKKQDKNGKSIGIQKKRVCAYCRVSTEEESQLSSYNLQKEYYSELISNNPDWEFAGIYADYGISGTSVKARKQFMQMIEDCKDMKIDMILTKSISRFARNTLDCLHYVRELQHLNPPVAIFFEKENLDTLDPKSELLLTILSSVAQEEARIISENLKWGIRKRFEAGKPMFPTKFLLGYDTDEDGNISVNEEEAAIVRRVYREYMEGKGAENLAKELKADGVPSGREGSWGRNSIMHMLKNERYCGDVIMQKVFTEDYLTHKCKANQGELPKYYMKDYHTPIIPRAEWEVVQKEIRRRHELATHKDPKLRQAHSSVSVMSNKLYCGFCGQPLTRKTSVLRGGGVRKKITIFRCRATSAKARRNGGLKHCYARSMQERRLQEAFMEMLGKLSASREDLENIEDCDMILEVLDSIEDMDEFKDEYFRQLVERGMVYDDGVVDYVFKNGFNCRSQVKLDMRSFKRKPKMIRPSEGSESYEQ